jgi:DNA invertase Pin-like site-specific DNA recombinase/DNA-binding transcriptional MerR regulator
MNIPNKIQRRHLTRQVIVYVRQSTPKQVQQHQESTRRQYQLVEQAQQWGWQRSSIKVIDEDLGKSGKGSAERYGFQRLVTSITLDEVGLILVTEVSRLSRLNSDWHRVIELCAVFGTLIADEDGLYNPCDPNDRLLLGVKGTLFAAELHILQTRMRNSLLNKARRGELALTLPVGYRRLPDEPVTQEPDEQVQESLKTIFRQFDLLKSARGVQRYFQQNQLLMPRLVRVGLDKGKIIWKTPTYQMIQQVLTSPVYAGVFVYGRVKTETIPGDPPRKRTRRLAMEEWEIVIPDVYPAYISYEQYLTNRQILRDNMYNFEQKGRGAVRTGRGLLQGRVVCGRCGRRMTPTYGSSYPMYVCRREQMIYGTSQCQSCSMTHIDEAISNCFLAAVEPAQLEMMLAALDQLEEERQTLERHWQQKLERAQYRVALAQRQYDAVDPDHRLVARVLEKRWNDALTQLKELEKAYASAQQQQLAPLTQVEKQAVQQLATDFPTVWQAETTTVSDRKQLLRTVIQEVTLTYFPEERRADFSILWSGQVTTQHQLQLPPIGWHCVTDKTIVDRLQQLAQQFPDHRIADILNAEGIHTQTGQEWTYERVKSIRKQHHIPTKCPIKPGQTTPRGDGLWSVQMAAKRLRVSAGTVRLWATQGILASDQRVSGSKLWVRVDESDLARLEGSEIYDELPRITDIMEETQLTREEVWQLVQDGVYIAYRARLGCNYEWRLKESAEKLSTSQQKNAFSTGQKASIVSNEHGEPHYE